MTDTQDRPAIPSAPPANHGDYALDVPAGEWIARLDYMRWGKRANLLCYFTDMATGRKYFFSFFHPHYGPRDQSMTFRAERIGTLYRLTTSLTARGTPNCQTAERYEPQGQVRAAFNRG